LLEFPSAKENASVKALNAEGCLAAMNMSALDKRGVTAFSGTVETLKNFCGDDVSVSRKIEWVISFNDEPV
jgi:hypothetical protein